MAGKRGLPANPLRDLTETLWERLDVESQESCIHPSVSDTARVGPVLRCSPFCRESEDNGHKKGYKYGCKYGCKYGWKSGGLPFRFPPTVYTLLDSDGASRRCPVQE